MRLIAGNEVPWLKREGDYVVVSAEDIYGRDVLLIFLRDGSFSHNISADGADRRFTDAYLAGDQEAR